MTAARTAEVFAEATSATSTKARTADIYVEAAANPTTRARTTTAYIEVVVGAPSGGWFMDALPMDLL